MAPVENVLAALDNGVKQILSEPIFPFGPAVFPILWQQDGAPHIRYYRSQIDFSCDGGGHLSERSLEALDVWTMCCAVSISCFNSTQRPAKPSTCIIRRSCTVATALLSTATG